METGRFRTKKVYFSQVSNHALRDTTLSLKAKGLYSLIQSYITIEGFTLYKSFLQKQCKDGRDSFNSSWNELKKSGYLIQYKMRDENNKFKYEYELLDVPEDNTIPAKENIPLEEDEDFTEICNAFIDAFNSKPNAIVKEAIKRYMFIFKDGPKEIILESINIAAVKNKGWDYSIGVLKKWIMLDLYTWEDVFNYLQK